MRVTKVNKWLSGGVGGMLLLAGCGGGGQTGGTTNPVAEPNASLVYNYPYYFDYNGKSLMLVDGYLQNGVLYSSRQALLGDALNPQAVTQLTLSQAGGLVANAYQLPEANVPFTQVAASTDLVLISKPYTTGASAAVQFTSEYGTIDLAGKPINQHIGGVLTVALTQLAPSALSRVQASTATFGAGASCRYVLNQQTNVPMLNISVTSSNALTISLNQWIADYAEQGIAVTKHTWQGTDWYGLVTEGDTAAPALLPYNGKLYTGLYLPVQQYQRDLSTNPAACEYFNSTALTQLRLAAGL